MAQSPVKSNPPLCCVQILHFPECFASGRGSGWMTAIRRRNADRHSDERAMAATGGGKIRSRRYHIASKPYAKNKQVNQMKVSEFKKRVEDVTGITLPLCLSSCYCFVGDIVWPAVSARGLHALLACEGNASKLVIG